MTPSFCRFPVMLPFFEVSGGSTAGGTRNATASAAFQRVVFEINVSEIFVPDSRSWPKA